MLVLPEQLQAGARAFVAAMSSCMPPGEQWGTPARSCQQHVTVSNRTGEDQPGATGEVQATSANLFLIGVESHESGTVAEDDRSAHVAPQPCRKRHPTAQRTVRYPITKPHRRHHRPDEPERRHERRPVAITFVVHRSFKYEHRVPEYEYGAIVEKHKEHWASDSILEHVLERQHTVVLLLIQGQHHLCRLRGEARIVRKKPVDQIDPYKAEYVQQLLGAKPDAE